MRFSDIEGYKNYQVTDDGRVWSSNKKGFLKAGTVSGGYQAVDLCKNGKRTTTLIHRLVAQAFIPNPDNLPEINHRDENPKNNVVENLEWCDHSYNINYGTRNEKVSKRVYQYTLDGKLVCVYPSTIDVVRNNREYNLGAISQCCNGKLHKHKGYIWSYKIMKEDL